MGEKDDIMDFVRAIVSDMLGGNSGRNKDVDRNIVVLSEYFDIKVERIKELDKIFRDLFWKSDDLLGILYRLDDVGLSGYSEYMYMSFKVGMAMMAKYFADNTDFVIDYVSGIISKLFDGAATIMNINER